MGLNRDKARDERHEAGPESRPTHVEAPYARFDPLDT
jgi:hypothetical protein